MQEVLERYARIAIDKAPHIGNPTSYAATARKTALEHPDLTRYLHDYPHAPPDAIAAWLHGDKHSQQYYRTADEFAADQPVARAAVKMCDGCGKVAALMQARGCTMTDPPANCAATNATVHAIRKAAP
jgi:hypothetical protein